MPGPETVPRPRVPSAPAFPSVPPARPVRRAPAAAPPGSRAGSRSGTHSAPRPSAPTAADPVGEVIRWAAFSCFLVPVVLLWCGGSPAGAAGTALGLAAMTGLCVILLRRSERGAVLLADEQRETPRPRARRHAVGQRRRHVRGGTGHAGRAGFAGSGNDSGARLGPWGKNGTGVHRGGRHSGGNKSVD